MSTVATSWWEQSFAVQGAQAMDKLLSKDDAWDAVLASGEADLQPAIDIGGLTVGRDRAVLDIGCGIGRITHALGLRFGQAVGIDIAPSLIAEANRCRTLPNIQFEQTDCTIRPTCRTSFDSIFSYEVLYYVPPELFVRYLHEAYELLQPGGEFVFHLNVEPIRTVTRISHRFRDLLFAMGYKTWRGWSNHPDFRRLYHDPQWVVSELRQAGFRVDEPRGTLRQMWFRAVRPACVTSA